MGFLTVLEVHKIECAFDPPQFHNVNTSTVQLYEYSTSTGSQSETRPTGLGLAGAAELAWQAGF